MSHSCPQKAKKLGDILSATWNMGSKQLPLKGAKKKIDSVDVGLLNLSKVDDLEKIC